MDRKALEQMTDMELQRIEARFARGYDSGPHMLTSAACRNILADRGWTFRRGPYGRKIWSK